MTSFPSEARRNEELDFFTSELDLKKVPKKSPTPTAKSPTVHFAFTRSVLELWSAPFPLDKEQKDRFFVTEEEEEEEEDRGIGDSSSWMLVCYIFYVC